MTPGSSGKMGSIQLKCGLTAKKGRITELERRYLSIYRGMRAAADSK